MRKRRTGTLAALTSSTRVLICCAVLLVAAAASAQSDEGELWVVEEGTLEVDLIDLATASVLVSVDVSDPDADGQLDPPWGIAFGTAPGSAGEYLFVTQQALVTTIDAGSRTIVGPPFDVGAAIGQPGLVLRGCAASPPRRFVDPAQGPVVLALLDVAATLPSGEAAYVVLDQEALLSGSSAGVVVSWGLLGSFGTAVSVDTGGLPTGGPRHEALYGTRRSDSTGDELIITQVALGEALGDAVVVEELERVALAPGAAPRNFRLGAPPGRRLPVMPQSTTGLLENLDTGGRCAPGGDISSVTVTGPGPNSYTVFALDRAAEELVLVGATDCASERFAVGAGPIDLITRGRIGWRSAFVANHDGDTITRLDDDGTLSEIVLAPPGPSCSKCPLSMAFSPAQACSIGQLMLAYGDFDLDGTDDDIHLGWDAPGCTRGAVYSVFCQCTDADPDCPCACSCDPPEPGCFCPGIFQAGLFGPGGPGDLPLQKPIWDAPVLENPWKKLGVSFDTGFDHLDLGDANGGWGYGVSLDEEPPP